MAKTKAVDKGRPTKAVASRGQASAVTTAGGIEAYRGPAAFDEPWSGWLRRGWHLIRRDDIVRLRPETREYLYSRFTPQRVRYAKGTRPALERLAEREIDSAGLKADASAHDVALKLAEWTYWEVYRRGEVIRRDKWSLMLIEGGLEEEIAALYGRTDSHSCSRLLAALLHVRGIPARLAFVFGKSDFNGRVGVEAFFDGVWRFLDVKANVHYVNRSGEIASLWEVRSDRYCTDKGVRGQANPKVDAADRAIFGQVGLANSAVEGVDPCTTIKLLL